MIKLSTVAVLCAVASAMPILPASADTTDEAQIKALENKFAAACNAGDINGIMAVYAPDVFVFDVVPPRQYVGAAAYRKDWEEFIAMMKGPVKFDISDLSVATDGNLGWGHSIQHVSGTDTKGQALDLTVRVTDVYRKTNGNWLIIHEHASVPVDLDTDKPDLSSKP